VNESPELAALVAEYRAGLDVELALLHRIDTLAQQQRLASRAHDLPTLTAVSDERDRVMANLVTMEHQLKPMRLRLAKYYETLSDDPRFVDLVARHREAGSRISTILSWDKESLEALKEAEIARNFAARTLEQGESTLAAYRRVVAPSVLGATLVDRKG
jgi:hypothetical protein